MKNLAPRFPSRRRRLYPHPALMLAAALTVSCSTAPPRQSALISRTGNIEMPTVELRLRVYGYMEAFAGDVEKAADLVLAATSDPEIEGRALRWKINILSSVQVAAFALDPLIGLFDVWVLTVQMREFFETGAGRDVFGEHQSIALETSRDLERKIHELVTSISVSGDISAPQRDVEAYAAAHPVTDMHFVRETVTTEFADVLAQERTGGLAVLADLSTQVGDLSERMKFYAASLPSQFRWQAELLLLELMEEGAVEDLLGDIAGIDASALRLADFADSLPDLVDVQMAAAIAALSDEVAASLHEVDRQRLETLEALTAERIAVMEQVGNELIAMMDQVAAIADSTLRRAPVVADEVVDHAFRRAIVLLGLIFVGGLIFAFLLRLMWRLPSAT